MLHAARSTVIFAHALVARELSPGCFDPEELFAIKELEPRLRGAGIRVADRDHCL